MTHSMSTEFLTKNHQKKKQEKRIFPWKVFLNYHFVIKNFQKSIDHGFEIERGRESENFDLVRSSLYKFDQFKEDFTVGVY